MAGRIRTIKPELLEDTRVAELSSDAFRLFIGMILLADDYGSLRADVRFLRSQVFWGLITVTVSAVGTALHELVSTTKSGGPLVELYEVRGQFYAHLCGWEKHQKVNHVGKPRVPEVTDPIVRRNVNASECFRDIQESLLSAPERLLPDLRPTTNDHDHKENVGSTDSEPDGSGSLANSEIGSPNHPAQPPLVAEQPDQKLAAEAPPSPVLVPPSPTQRPPAEVVHEAYVAGWKRTVGGTRPPKLDEKRRKLIRARLREFELADLLLAAQGVWKSSWHVENRRTDFGLVFRDAAHVEQFREFAERGDRPSRPPAANRPDVQRGGWTEDDERLDYEQTAARFAAEAERKAARNAERAAQGLPPIEEAIF